jgi:hypothetical protein
VNDFHLDFARPPGIGYSHPAVNTVWGLSNLIAAILLFDYVAVTIGFNASFISTIIGSVLTELFLFCYFNRLRNKKKNENTIQNHLG